MAAWRAAFWAVLVASRVVSWAVAARSFASAASLADFAVCLSARAAAQVAPLASVSACSALFAASVAIWTASWTSLCTLMAVMRAASAVAVATPTSRATSSAICRASATSGWRESYNGLRSPQDLTGGHGLSYVGRHCADLPFEGLDAHGGGWAL